MKTADMIVGNTYSDDLALPCLLTDIDHQNIVAYTVRDGTANVHYEKLVAFATRMKRIIPASLPNLFRKAS